MGFSLTRIDPPVSRGPQASPQPQSLPGRLQVELEIVRGQARQTRRQVVGKVFLIGSAADCDLVIGDAQFPDAYAYLYVQPDGVTVRHLGVGPGLVVRGGRVQTAQVQDGDVLECGAYAFRISIRHSQPKEDGKSTSHSPISTLPEKSATIPSADDVLAVSVGRSQVHQLLADIAAATAQSAGSLKVYRGPEVAVPASLAERVRRRASA